MAFPVVENKIGTGRTAAETTSPVSYPATVSVGATLVCIARCAVAGAIGWPAGWNELVENSSDGSDDVSAIAWRKAVGNEGGLTFDVTHGNGKSAYIVYSITGATDPTVTPPQISPVAVGTSATPDPTSLTPTGGAKDYLWLWLGCWEGEQTSPPASTPTNYINSIGASTAVAGVVATNCRCAAAQRNLNAASEDPPSWTISVSDDWSIWTMAVHPATNVVVTPGIATPTTTRYTPTVTVSNNQTVIPGVAALITTRFVATVLTPVTVVPGVASLTTIRFVPTILVGVSVVPGVASLITTRFMPTVLTPVVVVPGLASLITSRFTPGIVLGTIVIPGIAAITSTRFIPVISVSQNVLVTPGLAALITTRFVPIVIVYTAYGGLFLWTSANWGSVSVYLEVYMRATIGTIYGRLFNISDGAVVANSELSTTSSTFTRLRTSALTLANTKEYRVQFGKATGDAGEFLSGKLVITPV